MMTEMDAVFSASPALLTGFVALLGLLVGSFLNVVIHRLPKMLEREWQHECALLSGQPPEAVPRFNLLTPASHCPACQAPVRAWQNIPVLSFLLLRGRCQSCGSTIARRYPLVELMCGLMFAALAYRFGWTLDLLGYAALTATLIALAFIDADTQLLPDSLTLPLLWGGLLFSLLGGRVPLDEAVAGAMTGYVSLWLIFWLFKLVTGKEGMGYGDFKLLAALGAWLGWKMLPLVILLSSLVGALFGIALILLARLGRGQHLPFGPYLAVAGWIALLWGEQIVGWYLGGR